MGETLSGGAVGASVDGRRDPQAVRQLLLRKERGPLAFYKKSSGTINGIASIVLGLAIWQVAAQHANPLIMATLSQIWGAFVSYLKSGQLGVDSLATFQGFLYGFILASVAGALIGIIMATVKVVNDFLDPWVSALYSTPLVTLAPLFIIIFGIGLSAKVAIVAMLAIFPMIINTAAGIRTTDHDLIEAAYSFGASRVQIFRKVLLPSSVPFIVTGLRLAIGRGLIGVVVAEFFGSRNGLGHMIFLSAQEFDVAYVFMGVFILAGVGTLLVQLMLMVERWIAPWRQFRMP